MLGTWVITWKDKSASELSGPDLPKYVFQSAYFSAWLVSPISKVSLSDRTTWQNLFYYFNHVIEKNIQSLVLDHLYLFRDSMGQVIAPSTMSVHLAKAKDELFIHATLPHIFQTRHNTKSTTHSNCDPSIQTLDCSSKPYAEATHESSSPQASS